jgi:hypothetical protein
MTSFYEIDWRIASTHKILHTLSESINEINKQLDLAKEEWEIEDGVFQIEELLGVTFVVAQTYITGTVADVNRITKSPTKIKKELLLNKSNEFIIGSNITKLELCDGMANFYKHREEWTDWSIPGKNQKTIFVLNSVGIEQTDVIPFDKAVGLLWPEKKEIDHKLLATLLSEWRKQIIKECL